MDRMTLTDGDRPLTDYDAVRLHVRGFQTHEAGTVVAKTLEANGLPVEEFHDAESDTGGGLIGTQVVPTDRIDWGTAAECEAALRAAVPDKPLVLEWDHYRLADNVAAGASVTAPHDVTLRAAEHDVEDEDLVGEPVRELYLTRQVSGERDYLVRVYRDGLTDEQVRDVVQREWDGDDCVIEDEHGVVAEVEAGGVADEEEDDEFRL